MKKTIKAIALFIACTFILTGCWDQKVFEKLGLILSNGIEKSSDGKLLVTYVYPVIGGKEKDAVDAAFTEASLLRSGREHIRNEAPKLIESGKIQQVLISEELAKNGIHDILEIYQRDVAIPAISTVVVVEGSPKELLEKGMNFKNKPRISYYILQMLENNYMISNIPDTKVFDFDIDYYAPGIDPVVPKIKLEKELIRITGCALFSNDKMVGKLNNLDTIMLMGMKGKIKNTFLAIESKQYTSLNPNKYGIAMVLSTKKRKINIDFNEEGIPVINIYLKYECVLNEYKWNETNNKTEQKKIEKELSKQLTSMCNKTIKKMQAVNSDPIGLGNIIRAKYYKYWQSIDWKEVYPKAKINTNVNVEITKTGIIR